jgi:hypothetical protein
MCVAPETDFLRVLEKIRETRFAACAATPGVRGNGFGRIPLMT